MLPALLQRAWPRVLASFYTIPTSTGWMYVGASLATTAITVLPFGRSTGTRIERKGILLAVYLWTSE
jgi:hypothetical protein